jgi:hypothetical protein
MLHNYFEIISCAYAVLFYSCKENLVITNKNNNNNNNNNNSELLFFF